MKVTFIDPETGRKSFSYDVDSIFFLNQDTYGDIHKVGALDYSEDDTVLCLDPTRTVPLLIQQDAE